MIQPHFDYGNSAPTVAFRTMDRVRNLRDPFQAGNTIQTNVQYRRRISLSIDRTTTNQIQIIIQCGLTGCNLSSTVMEFDFLRYSHPRDSMSFITTIAQSVGQWEISCRACFTPARRVNTGNLELSLEKLQAHPGRGQSNNAWEVNTDTFLTKSKSNIMGSKGWAIIYIYIFIYIFNVYYA